MRQDALEAGERNRVEDVEHVAELFRRLDEVLSVDVMADRRPIRLFVRFSGGRIPAAAHDVITECGVTIEDASVDDGRLQLTGVVTRDFEYINSYPIRPHGNSLVITLSREALGIAGVGEDDRMAVYARRGEFRLKAREKLRTPE